MPHPTLCQLPCTKTIMLVHPYSPVVALRVNVIRLQTLMSERDNAPQSSLTGVLFPSVRLSGCRRTNSYSSSSRRQSPRSVDDDNTVCYVSVKSRADLSHPHFRAIGSLIEPRRDNSALSMLPILVVLQLDYELRPDNLSSMTCRIRSVF